MGDRDAAGGAPVLPPGPGVVEPDPVRSVSSGCAGSADRAADPRQRAEPRTPREVGVRAPEGAGPSGARAPETGESRACVLGPLSELRRAHSENRRARVPTLGVPRCLLG